MILRGRLLLAIDDEGSIAEYARVEEIEREREKRENVIVKIFAK
jgi:hypothetical protein